MKSFIIKISILVSLVAMVIGLATYSCSVHKELNQRNEYIREYEMEMAGKDKTIHELQMTTKQLKESKDTINQQMDSVLKILKIKEKNVQRIQYVDRELWLHDTVKLKDTLFVKDFDTTMMFNPYTSFKFSFIEPDSFVFEPKIESQMYVVTHLKREFVNTPSKVFFVRWFQKKRKVSVVDIKEENDLIQLKQSRFINIIDK